MNLRDVLARLSLVELRNIGNSYSFRLATTSSQMEFVTKLERHMLSPRVMEGILAQLTPGERRALDALIMAGGKMALELYTEDHGTIPYLSPYNSASYDRPNPPSPAEGLHNKGLIYRTYTAARTWSGEVVVIPDDVLAILPKVEKPPFSSLLETTPPPRHVMPAGDLVRDVGMLVCYTQRETVRAVHGDRLSKRDLIRLNADLSLQDDLSAVRAEAEAPWISFVHYVAASLGIVQIQAGLIVPSDKAEQWLKKQRWQQVCEAWDRYHKDAGWSDLAEAATEPGENAALSPAVVSARRRILAFLRLCPVQTWLSLASLNKAIKAHDPSFLRGGLSRDSAGYYSVTLYGGWSQVEARLIQAMLTGALRWFGIVEVGGETEKPPSSFRITERGAALLGLSPAPPPEPAPQPIVVQANFEVVVPRETSPFILFHLQRIAEVAKRDRASVYTLSQTAMWRYLQAGGKAERAIAFLEYASGRPLPQNVDYSLREWGARHGEVIIEQATLLRTTSEPLLKEIRRNRKIGAVIREEISPCAATLADGDLVRLIEQLRRAGYWPKTSDGILSPQRPAEPAGAQIPVAQRTLVGLLAAAIALQGICELQGWESPVSIWAIQNLSWRLPPALLKRVQQLVAQIVARYKTEVAEVGTTEK